MAGKMWAGRFTKEVDERVNDFNSSISFDARMYRYDIEGSMAHATMLGECGIIEKHESEKIVQGLKGILDERIDENKTRHISIEIHFNLKPIPEVEQVTA